MEQGGGVDARIRTGTERPSTATNNKTAPLPQQKNKRQQRSNQKTIRGKPNYPPAEKKRTGRGDWI